MFLVTNLIQETLNAFKNFKNTLIYVTLSWVKLSTFGKFKYLKK